MADYSANPGVPYEGNQPGSQKPREEFSTSEFLPQYINTKINKKFLRGTLDLMTSTASFETLYHYVGKQKTGQYDYFNDQFLNTMAPDKLFYNGTPGFVSNGVADTYYDYTKNLHALGTAGMNKDGVFSKYETYSPPIDNDKFVNFTSYYWCKDDLPQINIKFNVSTDPDDFVGLTEYNVVTSDKGTFRLLNGMRIGFAPTATQTFEGDASATAFTTTVNSSAYPLHVVIIDGVRQTADYTYSGTTLTFTTAPALGATIEILHFMMSDLNYYGNSYIVDGVGDSIQLIQLTDEHNREILSRRLLYSPYLPSPWDVEPWDSHPYDYSTVDNLLHEYVVMGKNSVDRNAWSRVNQWYHYNTIVETCRLTGDVFTSYANQVNKAKRPILEFDANIQIHNYGKEPVAGQNFPTHRYNVDYRISGNIDPATDIVGQATYNIMASVSTWSSSTIYNVGDRVKKTVAAGTWYFEAKTKNTNIDPVDTDLVVKEDTWFRVYDKGLQNREYILFNDISNTTYNNKVWQIGGQGSAITLTLVLEPVENDKILILNGAYFPVNYNGAESVYNAVTFEWTYPQQKTSKGLACLFELYDENNVLLSTYNNNDYGGNEIISYVHQDSASRDDLLGFKAKYNTAAGSSELVFEQDLQNSTYAYDIDTDPKTIRGVYYYKTSTGTFANQNLYSGYETADDLSLTTVAVVTGVCTSGNVAIDLVGAGQATISTRGSWYSAVIEDSNDFRIYERAFGDNSADNPQIVTRKTSLNPDIFLYAGETATFDISNMVGNLVFRKEGDVTASAPGITTTVNGDGTISVAVDGDPANYEKVCKYTSSSNTALGGRVRIVDTYADLGYGVDAAVLSAGQNNNHRRMIVLRNGEVTDDYVTYNNKITVFGCVEGDTAEVRYIPNIIEYGGYFEASKQWTSNPFNTPIGEHTAANLRAHFVNKIQTYPGMWKSANGVNDYYNSGKHKSIGGTILAQTGVVKPLSNHIKEDNMNFVLANRNIMNDYDNFKLRLVKKAEQKNFKTPYTTVRELFDETMREMNIGKDSSFKYARTNMVLWSNASFEEITIPIADTTTTFYLNNTFTQDTFSHLSDHMCVYLKDYDGSAHVEKLLIKDTDYTLVGNKLTLTSSANTSAGSPAVLTINYFDRYQNSYVPWSASKLGIIGKRVPTVSGTTLTGHDGSEVVITSTTNLYRPSEANFDLKAAVLFELEKRVYNHIMYEQDNSYNLMHRVKAGFDLPHSAYRNEFTKHFDNVAEYWISSTGATYPSLSNVSTANYSNQTLAGATLPGPENAVIQYVCGTTTPLTTPWEMFGYLEKPDWWDSQYSWTDAAKRTQLLDSLKTGRYNNPNLSTGKYDSIYITQLNMGDLITSGGVQQDIVTAGWVTAGATGIRWKLSDFVSNKSGVLADFTKSSAYPFAMLEAVLRTTPQYTWRDFYNPDDIANNGNTDISRRTRKRHSNTDPIFASPIPDATLTKIDVVAGGQNYTAPVVSLSGAGQAWAVGTVVEGGVIKSIYVTSGGYGWKSQPTVTITDTTGYGCSATATVSTNRNFHSIGIDAIIWNQNKNSEQNVDLHDRHLNMVAQPTIHIEGFTDKNVIKVRTLGNTSKSPFVIQDNDLNVILHKGHKLHTLVYSALKITRTSTGYRVDGLQNTPLTLDYLVANTNAAGSKTVTFGNQTVTVSTDFTDPTVYKLDYGHVFTDITELAKFVNGYLQHMKNNGLQNFDTVSALREMLIFTNSASVDDFDYILETNTLLLQNEDNYFLDSIFASNSDSLQIYDDEETDKKRSIHISNINVDRTNDLVEITTKAEEKILLLQANFVQYEHLLVLNNKTVFSDMVYSADIGMKYDNYKLEGRRTVNWRGAPSADGYLVNNTGLATNFDSSVREVEDDYLSIDSNVLNTAKRNTAKTTIGYNKKDWESTIPVTDDNALDFYRSAVSTKGTKENLLALGRNKELVDASTDTFTVSEEWLLKTSDFGADDETYVEFEFTDSLVKQQTQGIKFTNTGNADNLEDDIVTLKINDKRMITHLDTPNVFATGQDFYHQDNTTFTEFDGFLRNAGYPLVNEVDLQLLDINNIDTLYDKTKEYHTILQWDASTSYKRGDKVRYNQYVYQCAVDATGFDQTLEPITWGGTVNNPIVLPGNSLVIDGNTIALDNNVTTTTFNNIVKTSQASPVVNGGDTLVIDGSTVTFTKSSTTTTYPDFAVAGSTVNPTIQGSATKTLIIQGSTITFNATVATTINIDFEEVITDQFSDTSSTSVTVANRITAWTNYRESLQNIYGNAGARTRITNYLTSSDAGFDTSVLVDQYNATADATLQGHIEAFLIQDVAITNEIASTVYNATNVLNGTTPITSGVEDAVQAAFEGATHTTALKTWLTTAGNDNTVLAAGIPITTTAGTAFKVYTATEIRDAINAVGIANITASLVSNQLTITRSGRTVSDKDLVIGAGTANSEVDNAGSAFGAGSITHTGADQQVTDNTAQLSVSEIVTQINNASIPRVGASTPTGTTVVLTKTCDVNNTTLTLSGTAIGDLAGDFSTGTFTATSTSSTTNTSLDVALVAQKINDASITGVTAAVVDNKIVITSTNTTGQVNNTAAALTLGINANILGVSRSASVSSNITNTFDVAQWTSIGEPVLEYIWIADDNSLEYTTTNTSITSRFNGWNVFKVMDVGLYATKICAATTTGTGNDAEVQCNTAHNVQTGDIIMLLNTNSTPVIDGFHKVTGTDTASNVKFFIDQYIETDASYAKLLVLRNVRFLTDAQRDLALTSTNHYSFATNDKVWVDGTAQFKVYSKNLDDTWTTSRTQGANHVKQTTIKGSKLHDNTRTIMNLEVHDPFKNIIPGIADVELDYKGVNDPAIYTSSDDSSAEINPAASWAKDHIGEVWWDTNNAIYIDYEQDTVEYRTKYWGQLFEGSTIDVYEWTKSTRLPDDWVNAVDAGEVIDGVIATGTAYHRMINGQPFYYYTESIEFDATIGETTTFYYFWVKDKTTIPLGSNRVNSVLNVANVIKNPTGQSISWIAATGADTMIASNVRASAKDDSVLQVKSKTSDNQKHKHWTNVVENKTRIPEYFHNRMLDGIAGQNTNRRTKTFKGEYNPATAYTTGQVVYSDTAQPPFEITVAAKTAGNHYNGVGSANAYYVNGDNTDTGQVFTMQRGRSYLFDQNDATNVGHPMAFGAILDEFHKDYLLWYSSVFHLEGQIEYLLDGVSTGIIAYQTALASANTLQHRQIRFTPTATTPNEVWFGCMNHRNMGNKIYIVDAEIEETRRYYMALKDTTGLWPHAHRMAWRRIYNSEAEDAIEETIVIQEPKSVPDFNLHPLDRLGESVRPSRTWFEHKDTTRREIISKVNNMMINTLLVDYYPDYKAQMDVDFTDGSKTYNLKDFYTNVDWFHKDFDAFIEPNRVVTEITPSLTSRDVNQLAAEYADEYILAKDVLHADGITRDSIYKYNATDGTWDPMWKELGTIQINDGIWDPVLGTHGHDSVGFDNGGFDNDTNTILRKLLNFLRDNILTEADYNRIWFAGLYDGLQYQNNNAWVQKSTNIVPRLEKRVNTTNRIGYDAVETLDEYTKDNKPFTSKTVNCADGESRFEDAKTILEQTGLTITEQSKNVTIDIKHNEHTLNTFTENLAETAVLDNDPLSFVGHPIEHADANTGTITRVPELSSWRMSVGNVVSNANAIAETQHLVSVVADVAKVAYDRDHVYIRTSGVTDALGGPGYTVAPETEVDVKDQTPSSATQYNYKIPRTPVVTSNKTARGSGVIGVLTNGVAIKSPRDAEALASGSPYYRNEAYIRRYKLDGNKGTSVTTETTPVTTGLYFHYQAPSEYMSAENTAKHSPIIGWALDGHPIYGPYAYTNTNGTGAIIAMTSSYVVKSGTRTGIGTPGGSYDGTYTHDYQYSGGAGTLDEYNGRFSVTPEYPNGVYAYFATPTAYPYFVGEHFYGTVGGTHIYDGTTTIEPHEPFVSTQHLQYDVKNGYLGNSDFTEQVDTYFTHIWNGQSFVNRYEQHGSEQYFVDFQENLQVRVQTNASGATATADTRSFIYSQDNRGYVTSTTVENTRKTTTASTVSATAGLIEVSSTTAFNAPGLAYIGNEIVRYVAVDASNNLVISKRGVNGTPITEHASGATIIDASAEIPALDVRNYGNTLLPMYNDSGTSLATGTGTRIETQVIRSAGQGELF